MSTFEPSISGLPPQLSSVITTADAPNHVWPPKRLIASPPVELWQYNLKDIFQRYSHRGLSPEDLQQVFKEDYDHYIIPQIFGFLTLEELLLSIPELKYRCGMFHYKL